MALEVGQRIGDYEVLALLGSGGMGRVYKVRNIISNREEAMKVLLPDFAAEAELAARFMAEIRTLAGLEHPNIAQLRTAFQFERQFVMVMEFVEGTTLDRMAQTNLTLDQVLDYSMQVLSALQYAHSRGVTHRDIKPANIMVTSHGLVKLMDFGIAKSANDMQLTRPGTTMGSVYYISPEQVGGGTVDARSDIYSFGVTLYEMLTGRKPFEADTSFAVLYAHMNEAPTPPVEVNPALPAELNNIVLKAMNKDPQARFQSADEFRNALKSVRKPAGAPQVIESAPMPMPMPIPAPMAQPQAFAASGAMSATAASAQPMGYTPVPTAASGRISATGAQNPLFPPAPTAAPPAASATPAQGFAPAQGYAPVPVAGPVAVPGGGKSHRGLWIGLGALAAILALVAVALVLPRVFSTHASQSAATSADASAPAATPVATAPPAATSPAAAAQPETPAPDAAAQAGTPSSAPAAQSATPSTAAGPSAAEPGVSTAPAGQSATNAPAPPRPTYQKPREKPVQIAQAAAPAPVVEAPPAPAGPPREEIRHARERLLNLEARADAARSGVLQIQSEQQKQGLDLRGDILAARNRMNANLREANRALNEGDLQAARECMERADHDMQTLESFLGR